MNYSVDYFLEKFDAIPEIFWHIGEFESPLDTNKKCALGHCEYDALTTSYEGNKLMDILRPVVQINDGKVLYDKDFSELGDTPKERVLNALLLVKVGLFKEAMGYK